MSAGVLSSAKASQTASVFSCGLAAEHWGDKLAKCFAKLDDLRRLCIWMGTIVQKPSWIDQEPLFGQGLTDCMCENRRNVRPGQRRPPNRKSAGSSTTSDAASRRKRNEFCQFSPVLEKHRERTIYPCKPLPEELRTPRGASQELLWSLAPPFLSSDAEEKRSPFPVFKTGRAHKGRSRDFLRFCAGPPKDHPAQKAPLPSLRETSAVFQDNRCHALQNIWRENVSWRAGQALQLAGLTTNESGDPKLSVHWDVPIAGPEAPSEVLAADLELGWEDSSAMQRGERPERATTEVWNSEPVNSLLQQAEEREPRSRSQSLHRYINVRDDAENKPDSPETRKASTAPREREPGPGLPAWLGPDLFQEVSVEQDPSLPSGFATRSFVPSLPPAYADVLPDAAGSRKRVSPEAWHAEVSEEEELNILSQKLQRILEDEARRFGVSV